MMASRTEKIRDLLQVLSPRQIDIEDQSHLHAGHPGAASGGGHYRLTIVSDRFIGKSPLARHRVIFDALDEMMRHDIHALSITALTFDEASSAQGAKTP
ncbi:MAG TPA: BolA family protein [Rhodocyclaceae bacterium]|nr:BolA family protein [Rhodocyclaceae bacterium]